MFAIRNASIEDAPSLAKTQVDSYQTTYAGLLPPAYLAHFTYEEQQQDWADLLQSDTSDLLLVASMENKVIGYALARAKPDIFPGYDAELVALHVQKPFQGQGIGKSLFKETIKRLSEGGCLSVMLWTLKGNPTRQWYEKLGGKFLSEKHEDIDGWTVSEVAYGWKDVNVLLAFL